MRYSKDKAIIGKLCMCETGRLWFDGKDITDNLFMLWAAKSIVNKFGSKKQKEQLRKFRKIIE